MTRFLRQIRNPDQGVEAEPPILNMPPTKKDFKAVSGWIAQAKPPPEERVLRIEGLGAPDQLPVGLKIELLISLPLIGQQARALQLAPTFYQLHSNSADVSSRIALLYAQNDMPDEALPVAGNCLSLFNASSALYAPACAAIDVLRLAGAYSEAHEVAGLLLERYPYERMPLVAAINLGIASGRAAESAEHCHTLAQLSTRATHVHRLLAKQAIAVGDVAQFLRHRDVLRLWSPDNPDTLLIRAQAAYLDRAKEPAIGLLQDSRSTRESLAARLLYSLAVGSREGEAEAIGRLYRPEFAQKYHALVNEAPSLSPMQQLQRIQAICLLPRKTPSKPVRELLGVGEGPLVA